MNNIENQRGYKLLSAILSTDRNDASIDIAPSITDIDLFEHMDKPYLTATIIFLDDHGIVQQIDMQGIEKLTLQWEALNKNVLTKDFRVGKIFNSTKGDDRSEVVVIELIEEHAYLSNAINVNKCYVGTPASMVTTIASEHLNKDVQTSDNTFQGNMKVIVPNLTPLKAIKWLQQRATNQDGMPYYAYSLLSDNVLRFKHLGDIITQTPSNKNKPFVYSQASATQIDGNQHYIIESYKYENVENMFSAIQNGFSGARYQFLNASNGFLDKIDFDAKVDVFDNIKDKNYLGKNQDNYNFPVNSKIKDIELNKQKSKTITRISSSSLYNGSGDFKTYGEEQSAGAYKKNIVGHALKHYMTKTPISIAVKGSPFLMDGGNLTVGTVIRIKFFDSNVVVDRSNTDIGIDKKKSGDYMIYACRHSFKIEKYDLNLLCTKIANYTGENL